MWPFKKKIKPLNNTVLLQYRHEAYGRLRFMGGWSGWWETRIDSIDYRSERVSGFKAVTGDVGNFVIDAIIDRAKLRKNPDKYREEIDMAFYGGYRYVCSDGCVEQWNW